MSGSELARALIGPEARHGWGSACITNRRRCDTLTGMRSLRLDDELEDKVQRAAAVAGESVSEFIRQAAEERAEKTLGERGRDRFRDVAGVVHGGGGRARRSGEAFTDAVSKGDAKR
jgi:hypothetical protein